MTIRDLAQSYFNAVHAAANAAVRGEEEAQLTTATHDLFVGLTSFADLGRLRLVRETRLDRTRPDFAALLTVANLTRQKGFIELKAPSISVDTTSWSGRNEKQWSFMSLEAEVIIVANGRDSQLYISGVATGASARLPYEAPTDWDPSPLITLLRNFYDAKPLPVVSVRDLAGRLAFRTADLRDRLVWLLTQEGLASDAAKGSYRSCVCTFTRKQHPEVLPTVFLKSSLMVWYSLLS